MKYQKENQKLDRRTRYTRDAIKDSMLEAMKKKSFNELTITEICKIAEINRGTFYLHYLNLTDVLDEILEDIFDNTSDIFEHLELCMTADENKCLTPFCLEIQQNKKYKTIFLDASLTALIIRKIDSMYKERFVTKLVSESTLAPHEAEAIFIFQVNGCFAVNMAMHWKNDNSESWCPLQEIIDGFIQSGLKRFME